jgi:WD40 repeat protein
MYSGCKDGTVKVWRMNNHKQIRCTAHLSVPGASVSGASSINTIGRIDKQYGKMFATGGADKQIRLWKFHGTYSEDADDVDGQPDFEMVDEHPSRLDFEDEMEFDNNIGDTIPQQTHVTPVSHI